MKYEIKEIMKIKAIMTKDKIAMKIIIEAVIQSIIMKKDQIVALKITIKEFIVTMKENLKEMKIIKRKLVIKMIISL